MAVATAAAAVAAVTAAYTVLLMLSAVTTATSTTSPNNSSSCIADATNQREREKEKERVKRDERITKWNKANWAKSFLSFFLSFAHTISFLLVAGAAVTDVTCLPACLFVCFLHAKSQTRNNHIIKERRRKRRRSKKKRKGEELRSRIIKIYYKYII